MKEISDNILNSITTLLDNKLQKLNFDKTFQCTIWDKNTDGTYQISYMNQLYNVPNALGTDLELGQRVWVKIPNGIFRKMHICSGNVLPSGSSIVSLEEHLADANAHGINTHTGNTDIHITANERTNWNDANAKKHTHSNQTILDNTTASYTTAEQAKLEGIEDGANAYTLPAAGTSLGGVKSGGDVVISNGIITVNDDSHNHTIGNVDGLQSALAAKVPTTRTINGKALSTDITLSASDIGADASGSANTALASAKAYTDTELEAALAEKSDIGHSHAYSSLTGLPTIPTKTSQLTNDSGYKTTDNNTTYQLSKSGSTITLTGSDGTTTSVTDSDTNTTYTAATASSPGLMSAADKTKLDTIATGANAYSHPTSGVTAGTFKSVTVNAQGHVTAGTNPTTLKGYGITDAASASDLDLAYANSNAYTDTRIAELINGAPETLDTLKEVADAISENASVVEALDEAIGTKANQSELDTHTGNSTIHITNTERSLWNTVADKVDAVSGKGLSTNDYTTAEKTKLAGIAAGAEVNQNAFSNVVVGSTTIAADAKSDSLTLAGSNVTLTPDATNDKVTIGITKANVVNALGYTPPTANTTYGVATSSALGLVKSGTDITVDANGNVSVNDDSHKHTIANVDGLQTALDGKAASSHGTHVSYSTTAPVMDGTASVGSAATVARSDHRHPTDTSRAAANHTHSEYAASSHTHSDYVNQNAFSNVTVGTTTIAADTATDTLTLEGSNVTLTPDATNDKVTIGITKANVVSALGYTPPTANTTYGVATSSVLGLVKSGTDITVDSSGNVSVNDDSHNHTIANVDGLQTALDGKAASSHGTHVTFTTTVPNANGTAATGSATTVSRSDHVHPAQTTVSGNAGTATKLATARTIQTNLASTSSAAFNGTANVTPGVIGTLSIANGGTGATTAAAALTNLGLTATATELNYMDGVTSAVQTQLNAKAPKSHASSATTYGRGSASVYGHVKLSDTYASKVSSGTAAYGLAASQNALYNSYAALLDKLTWKMLTSASGLTGVNTISIPEDATDLLIKTNLNGQDLVIDIYIPVISLYDTDYQSFRGGYFQESSYGGMVRFSANTADITLEAAYLNGSAVTSTTRWTVYYK